MKVALVSMQPLAREEAGKGIFAPEGESSWEQAEIVQTLALALTMRDRGNFDPCIICQDGGELARQASELALPCLALHNARNALSFLRLWQWQRKEQRMLVLANGESSLSVAGKLLLMTRGKAVVFVPAFFLRAPRLQKRQASLLLKARCVVCGSAIIKKEIISLMRQNEKWREPHWIEHPAGLDLGQYPFQDRVYSENDIKYGKHFIFGMAGSLQHNSGALLVVRAMAALWQAENVPSWEVRMNGTGPRFDEIMGEAASLGVLGRLAILGEQLPDGFCRNCHVWLAPGSASFELPQVMGNAGASGLPLLCVSSPLHKDWLAYMPPNVALMIEKDNPQELARAMLSLMRDAALRKHFAQASRDCRLLTGAEETANKVCSSLEHSLF